MNFTIISSIMTTISLIVFLGIIFWAYNSKNKSHFEDIGRLSNDEELLHSKLDKQEDNKGEK